MIDEDREASYAMRVRAQDIADRSYESELKTQAKRVEHDCTRALDLGR